MWPLKASTPVSAAQGGSRCGKDAALWLTVGDGDGEGDGRERRRLGRGRGVGLRGSEESCRGVYLLPSVGLVRFPPYVLCSADFYFSFSLQLSGVTVRSRTTATLLCRSTSLRRCTHTHTYTHKNAISVLISFLRGHVFKGLVCRCLPSLFSPSQGTRVELGFSQCPILPRVVISLSRQSSIRDSSGLRSDLPPAFLKKKKKTAVAAFSLSPPTV